MTRKELEEEIEYVHSNRLNKGLLRPLHIMDRVILNATNTYTNLMLFRNDYFRLLNSDKLEESVFYSAMNDLYLLALLHTTCEDIENDK